VSGKRRVRDFQKTDPHLRDHPAFLKFTRTLGVNANLSHGILSGLWSFAFKFAHDGDLSRFEPEDIGSALGWDDLDVWSALVASGFVGKDGVLHDWHEWGGAIFFDRQREAQRKWDERNPSEQEQLSEDKTGQCPEEKRIDKKPPYSPPKGDERFEVFWAAYPPRPHNNRQKAVRAWNARIKAGEDADRLIAASRHYAIDRATQDPTYTLLAATFLGPDLRYETYVDPPKNGNGGNGGGQPPAPDGMRWAYIWDIEKNCSERKLVPDG
jgi:hypothetical protein